MNSAINENKLIAPDIADVMQDYVSIQLDIDPTRVKAASLVAQKDIERVVGKASVKRCLDLLSETDNELRELIIPPLCYYTYARCLKMFQGNFTDSGYATETEVADRNSATSVANEMRSIGDTFMKDVLEFLDAEKPDEPIARIEINPRIRVFGGSDFGGH